MKIRNVFILCFWLLSCTSWAADKKPIQVDFKITEPQYVSYFGTEVTHIEKACSSSMADLLNHAFGFFQFTVSENQHVLHIELTDSDQNAGLHSALKEVGFKAFILPDENMGPEVPVYWVFRPVEKYIEALPDVNEEFINEVLRVFKTGLDKNKDELVKNILSKVELADDFYFIQEKKIFIIPFTKTESNIADSSLFTIVSMVSDDILEPTGHSYKTQVFGSIQDIETAIAKYHLPNFYPKGSLAVKRLTNEQSDLSNTNVVSKQIYILKHVPMVNSTIDIASPETLINSTNLE